MQKLVAALAVAFGTTASASATDIRPLQGRTVDLGGVRGSAYYVVSGDRYDVVATLTSGEGMPVRVAAQLEDGQSVTLSVPASVGGTASGVDIVRNGSTVRITQAKPALN